MRRNRGGFTILEVMIFLAISGAMVAAAMVAINGQQSRTEFTQGMRDIDSKLQDTLNDVSNGNFSYNNSDCVVLPSGAAKLQGAGTGIGSRSQCLFLGEAVQFESSGTTGTPAVDNNSRFAIYTVLGRRLKDSSISGAQVSVSSFADAKPTAQLALTSYYPFEAGIRTKAVYFSPSASQTTGKYSLLGLYTSFKSASDNIGAGGVDASQSLQPYVYNLPDDGTSYGDNAKACIDANNAGPSGSCIYNTNLSSAGGSKGWGVCFDSNNGTDQTALITIYTTSEGVGTRLEFNPAGTCLPS